MELEFAEDFGLRTGTSKTSNIRRRRQVFPLSSGALLIFNPKPGRGGYRPELLGSARHSQKPTGFAGSSNLPPPPQSPVRGLFS